MKFYGETWKLREQEDDWRLFQCSGNCEMVSVQTKAQKIEYDAAGP